MAQNWTTSHLQMKSPLQNEKEIESQGAHLDAEILEDHINAGVLPSNWENSEISIAGSRSAVGSEIPV